MVDTKISISELVNSRIPTEHGDFRLYLFKNSSDNKEHMAFVLGDIKNKPAILTRVHSECFTGDVLGSIRCDCGEQLNKSLELISKESLGVLIYMRQEGRGIGLTDKLKAYNLQDKGFDTLDANLELGHQADIREYSVTAAIINYLGINSIQLMTNNPAKIEGLKKYKVKILGRIPIPPTVNLENQEYLHTKATRMDHILDISKNISTNS